jgi:hypothetical protein
MCKEMPLIPVDRVVDTKRIIGKMEVQGRGRHKGSLTPPPQKKSIFELAVGPNDPRTDDGVLVSSVEDLDVQVVRVRVHHQEHEPLLENGVRVVVLRPEIQKNVQTLKVG